MLAGVSTRKFAVVGEPVGSEVKDGSSATSKSTVSELFIERTRTALGELMSRRLDDVAVLPARPRWLAGHARVECSRVSKTPPGTHSLRVGRGAWDPRAVHP